MRVQNCALDPAFERMQDKHQEAVALLETALSIRVSALGEGHNDTKLSQINLKRARGEVGGNGRPCVYGRSGCELHANEFIFVP